MNSRWLLILIISVFLFTSSFCSSKSNTYLILATATTGGTYYPAGVGIAMLTSTKIDSLNMTAITSAGSGENIQLIKNREADLAILQGLYGAMAWQGKGIYDGRPEKELRSVSMLWENVEHFVILSKFAGTGNISDLANLRGKNFSIGKRGSGTEISGRVIMRASGFDPDEDFDLQYLGYSPSAAALQDGRISGMNIPAGPPASSITQAAATIGPENIKILEFTGPQIDAVNSEYPVWTRFVLKRGTYPGQKEDIKTISQSNILVVHRDISEESVYRIVKSVYENLSSLQNIHPATKAMSLEKAITGLTIPLHPGAARYYRENGIDIPPHLIYNPADSSREGRPE